MASYRKPDAKTVQELKDVANKLRLHSINATTASGSGHPTSCASAAEVMSVLFFNTMRYKVSAPKAAENDRFILSKGHAAPVLYAAWAETGLFPREDLLKLRKIDCDLEGHPTPRLNFVDVATGSLGQGLSVGAGMAYVGKYFDKADYRTYVMMGDGESAEGSIWEAMAFCSHYKLDNIVSIFDVNRLGQSEPTAYGHDMEVYRARCEAFGWNTYVVDGHDVEALCKAFHDAQTVKGKPTAIVCKTFKGMGIPTISDELNWHGKALGAKTEASIAAITERIVNKDQHTLSIPAPERVLPVVEFGHCKLSKPPAYELGQMVGCRLAYGVALAKLGEANPQVVAMDGDTKNSTFSIKLKEATGRYVECFIAEQNLIGVAVGAACRDRTVAFASTFACFLERGYDQLRMAAVSQTNANFCGSHVGVSIGEDGPSQMALEDIACFRAIPTCTVFYPSDAVSMERATELAANTKGMCFLRSTRGATPVVYKNDEVFEVGKGKVLRQSANDQVTVIGAGITTPEVLKAADELAKENIHVRVLDLFTIKPLDEELVRSSVKATGGRIVVVEDHYAQGGIGEAVMSALSSGRRSDYAMKHCCVREMPRSGKPDELLEMFGLNSRHAANAIREVLKM